MAKKDKRFNSSSVRTQAILVCPTFTVWNPIRTDPKVSEEVATKHKAKRRAGMYKKRLIVAPELKIIENTIGRTRVFHYKMTLPWDRDGTGILPSRQYFSYMDKMRTQRSEFLSAVKQFLQVYKLRKKEAQQFLGTMYRVSDYPTVQEVASEFSMRVLVHPIPSSGDFRISLKGTEIASIRKQLEGEVSDRVGQAMNDLWSRLHKAVARLKDRLGDGDRVLKSTLVLGLRELCETLPQLNVMGDTEFDRITEQIRNKLTKHTAEVLRGDTKLRQDMANEADKICRKMAGFMGTDAKGG